MLWRMPADLPDKRIGVMDIFFAAPQPVTNVSATNWRGTSGVAEIAEIAAQAAPRAGQAGRW